MSNLNQYCFKIWPFLRITVVQLLDNSTVSSINIGHVQLVQLLDINGMILQYAQAILQVTATYKSLLSVLYTKYIDVETEPPAERYILYP